MEEELVFGFGVSKLSHLQKGSMNMLFAKGLRASDLSCLRAHELAPQAGSHNFPLLDWPTRLVCKKPCFSMFFSFFVALKYRAYRAFLGLSCMFHKVGAVGCSLDDGIREAH